MNRLLLAATAMAAFAVTWQAMSDGGAAAARSRAAQPAAPATAAGWPIPQAMPAAAVAPGTTASKFIAALDADLGSEGTPVDRAAIESALSADPELRRALGLP